MTRQEPTYEELQTIMLQGERCLSCSATNLESGSPCYEFTPEGVEVCSQLPFWQGKPVTRQQLRQWREKLVSYEAVPHRSHD